MAGILWDIFELTVTVFEQFVIAHFICGFLGHDYSTPKGKIIFVSGALGGAIESTILDKFVENDGLLGAAYVTYWLLFALLFLKGKILIKLFAVLLQETVAFFSSTIALSSVSAIFKSTLSELYYQSGFIRFIVIIMAQLCIFYFLGLILKLVHKDMIKLKRKEWGLIISVFAISFLSVLLIRFAMLNMDVETDSDVYTVTLLLAAEAGIVALNSICLYMTIALSKGNSAAEELKLKTQQYEHSIQYAETIRGQYDEMRSIRHDIKQHFAVIRQLQQDGNLDEAEKYIDSCAKSVAGSEMFIDVGDVFINAILNSKLSIAKSRGIEVMCRSGKDVSGINAYDLCNLLGNMLDNAIDGAQGVTGGRFIEVAMESDEHKLNICISNSIACSVLIPNKELTTSKADRNSHGFGTKTIRSLAKKYNGNVDYYEEGLIFFCHVILYK